MKFTIVIQAGGESKRMGRNKALVDLEGKPLIQHVYDQLKPAADEILVTTHFPESFAFLDAHTCTDVLSERGNLSGLYTSLACAAHPVVGLAACDMPFASPQLFRYEADLLEEEGMDVVIPATDKGLEPFHAVYRKETCQAAVLNAIQRGERRMVAWFSTVRVKVLTPADIAVIDPSPYLFFNVNTEEDLLQAQEIMRQSARGGCKW